jgi:hypothetical protein
MLGLLSINALLGREPLPSLPLGPSDHVADIGLFGRPAVETLLDFGAQRLQFDLALFTLIGHGHRYLLLPRK